MAEMITLREYLDELGRMLEQDAPTEVISHCRYILQHFPQNVDTYRLLGKALLQKGHQENRDEYFSEAAEVFRRVLGAVPNDHVAHLVLSETHEREGELDQAIWHLERAYEQMPGNATLQDALRELYVKRDGEEQAPARIQLTRGALARQYMNGQLYDQAVAELQAALVQHADRVDLQVMLAEALWNGWHEVEAGEMAVRVLKRLPNCLVANRILAQLWLDNERPTDARPFLDRVEALDPYAAAYLLQPGVENADHVEIERLDYYRQSQAELSAQTPGWVHELDADMGTGDLWVAPESAEEPAETAAAPGPERIDMASLFAAASQAAQGNVSTPDDWQAEMPPGWLTEPEPAEWAEPAADEAMEAAGPEYFAESPPVETGMGESDDAAIEADWLFEVEEEEPATPQVAASEAPALPHADEGWLPDEGLPGAPDVWDELRAAVGGEDEPALPETVMPVEEPPGELVEADDILAALGIFDAEWGAAAGDEEQQPAGFAFEWEAEPVLPGEAGAGEQSLMPEESPPGEAPAEVAPGADAGFIDHLAEMPDFEQLGVDDLDWSVFQGALEVEESGEPESEIAAPVPPVSEGEQLITADELRFLDELAPAGSGPAAGEDELLRDEIDAAFQEFLAADQLLGEAADTEAISAPEWLPAWGADMAAGEVPDIPAEEPGTPDSGEMVMESWLDETLPEEGVPQPEALDAELLAAIAAAGEGDEGAAQPAADLPAWVREAAPLSERPADEDAQLPAEERAFEGVAGSEAPSVPEGETREEESALLAEWEAWEAAQESVAPVGEGGEPLESGTSEEGWLASFVLAESEPTQEEASLAEIGDEAALLDEAAVLEAAPLAETEPEDVLGWAEAEGGAETGELGQGEVSPAWLEELSDLGEAEVPAEVELEDLAALLDRPYDAFEEGEAPRYDSAGDMGILQPDEQPDWMAAFTGEEIALELGEEEEVDALLSGETETAEREELPGAVDMEGGIRADEFVPGVDSGEERGEPLLAPEAELPFDLDVPAEEGEIPDWLLAIADSEAHKLDELFAGEEVPEVQESALDVQDLEESDLAMPESLEAAGEAGVAEQWDVAEEALPGDAEAEMVWEESEELLAVEEAIAVASEADWPDTMAAEVATGPVGAPPGEYDDEPVPDDFSFGDWLPVWLRKPLEGGPGGSPGLSHDEASEPPEWLRDVNEDEQ